MARSRHKNILREKLLRNYVVYFKLDGWCEGGIGQQRYDGGGCATAKDGKSGELRFICNRMSLTRPFLIGPVFFRTTLEGLWWLASGEGLDAVT